MFPGSALSPFLNKFTITPSLDPPWCVLVFPYPIVQHNRHGNHSFSSVLGKFLHYLVCPCCVSVLKFSCTLVYLFPCELSHCNPSEPLLSSLLSNFAYAHALISFSNSASKVSLVVGVPSLRQCSINTSTSLSPSEILTISPFCVLNVLVAIPVSCLSCLFAQHPFYPYPHLLHPAVNVCSCFINYVFHYSLSLLVVLRLLPSFLLYFELYSILLPSCRSLARCKSCVCLSPFLCSLFYSVILPFYCSAAYYQPLAYYFTCCALDQLLTSFRNPRSCTVPFHIVLSCTYAFQELGILRFTFLASLVGPLACFSFAPSFIYSPLVPFLKAPIFFIALVCLLPVHGASLFCEINEFNPQPNQPNRNKPTAQPHTMYSQLLNSHLRIRSCVKSFGGTVFIVYSHQTTIIVNIHLVSVHWAMIRSSYVRCACIHLLPPFPNCCLFLPR